MSSNANINTNTNTTINSELLVKIKTPSEFYAISGIIVFLIIMMFILNFMKIMIFFI